MQARQVFGFLCKKRAADRPPLFYRLRYETKHPLRIGPFCLFSDQAPNRTLFFLLFLCNRCSNFSRRPAFDGDIPCFW